MDLQIVGVFLFLFPEVDQDALELKALLDQDDPGLARVARLGEVIELDHGGDASLRSREGLYLSYHSSDSPAISERRHVRPAVLRLADRGAIIRRAAKAP